MKKTAFAALVLAGVVSMRSAATEIQWWHAMTSVTTT